MARPEISTTASLVEELVIQVGELHVEHIMFKPPTDQRVPDRIGDGASLKQRVLHRLAGDHRGDEERLNLIRQMLHLERVLWTAPNTT